MKRAQKGDKGDPAGKAMVLKGQRSMREMVSVAEKVKG